MMLRKLELNSVDYSDFLLLPTEQLLFHDLQSPILYSFHSTHQGQVGN